MTKRSYTSLQEEVNRLLTKEDERTQQELDALQLKLDEILSNQDEILTRLGVVAQGRYSINVGEVADNFFPISDSADLAKLDSYLEEPGNPYARLMRRLLRPDGEKTPLSKSIRKLFADNIMLSFNYAGVANKKAFNKYENINKTIMDIQKSKGYILSDYIKEIRGAINAAKHRSYKRVNAKKQKSKVSQETEDESEYEDEYDDEN